MAKERPRGRQRQQHEHRHAQREQQELPQLDAARVLLLRAPQVAQRGEDHTRALLALEEMQNEGHRGREAQQQQERAQESHQPSRSRLRR